MKTKFLLFGFVCALLIACTDSSTTSGEGATNAITAVVDPFEQNARLGRGINLGNSLEAPSEGDWSVTLHEEYFRLIKEKGFDSVRIPVRWSAHTSDTAPFTIDEHFFERVDWAIEQSLKNDLMVIINVHHYMEIFDDPAAEEAKFLSLWQQIASRYANQSSDLIFEVLNEPHHELTAARWNKLLPKAINVIRATNPHRTLFIGAAEWGGVPGLLKLAIPDDDNLIVTVHYYEPFKFTHQGAGWVEDADEWLGTEWTGTPEQVDAIREHFQTIVDWAEARNLPVNIGEFGAYSKADSASRAKWSSEVVRFALENEMSYHYWEFASGFGIYNPRTEQWDTQLLNALVNTQAN
ncbi:glycoside hydrolase family 5 protein [Alteromonas gilva]|uniref:Glycoside hydrolase family 5 protein n=1 Tax=Alteromonas gilva TaxID=2987522 RepID=A0ABT5L4N0_9ALTE|nr:glycoside hydrolase family 5 protein [Alteromonas gilva]MDC8831989.1 glycoside hydrolase family 5 protein [Alteromonas gilva]